MTSETKENMEKNFNTVSTFDLNKLNNVNQVTKRKLEDVENDNEK